MFCNYIRIRTHFRFILISITTVKAAFTKISNTFCAVAFYFEKKALSKLKNLAGQTIIYGLSTVLVRALNWLLAPFHSLVFETDPAGFGVVAELFAYVAFVNVVFMYGMETAFFRYATKRKEKAETVYSTALLSLFFTTVILVSILVFQASNISSVLQLFGKEQVIIIIAIIIGFDTLSNLPFAKLRLNGKPLKYVGIKLFNVLINIGLSVLLLLPIVNGTEGFLGFSSNPENAVKYVFLANLVASIITLLVFLPSILNVKFTFDLSTWKDMMRYGMPLIIVGLAGTVNETLDRILLKIYLPQETIEAKMTQVGIYSMAYKLSIVMAIAVQGFRMGAEPFFFKRATDKDAKQTYAEVMKYFVIVSLLIFLGVSLNLDWIGYIITKPFRPGLKIVPIVLLAYMFLGIFYNLSVWYKVTDNTMKATYIALAGAILTVAVNVIFIPKYGYIASAWATFCAYFLMTLVSWLWGRAVYRIPYNLKKIVAYILLAIGLFIVSTYINGSTLSSNIILKNTCLVFFLILAYWFDGRKLIRSSKDGTEI